MRKKSAQFNLRFTILLAVILIPCGLAFAQGKPVAKLNQLPPGFRPPRKVPSSMKIEKELLTDEQEKTLFQELKRLKYANVLRSGELTAKNKPIIAKTALWRVHRLSMKKYRRRGLNEKGLDLPKLREELYREIRTAGIKATKPAVARDFRKFYLGEIRDRIAELMDGNFYVRFNGIAIFEDLSIVEEKRARKIKAEAYSGGISLLMQVLTSQDQHEAIKISAAKSLGRVALTGTLNGNQKDQIAKVLISELNNKAAYTWYQIRLTEALGAVDRKRDAVTGKTLIFNSLFTVLKDANRDLLVRAEAAKSLGRIPLDSQIDVGGIVVEVLQLTKQSLVTYQAQPRRYYWPEFFLKIYLTFKRLSPDEVIRKDSLVQKFAAGSLGAHQKKVSDAYQAIVPLARHVLLEPLGTPFPQEAITRVDTWLKNNQLAGQPAALVRPAGVLGNDDFLEVADQRATR